MPEKGKYNFASFPNLAFTATLYSSPEVFVTLTSDIGKVLTALHTISLGGKANFTTGVNIAQV